MRKPDFFLVGAPKCGTTAMYEYLRHHPSLFLPEKKELRYFGKDLQVRHYPSRRLDEYLRFFSGAESAQRVGTAYVWYLYSKTAAAEIAAFAPNAQALIMLRQPADMLYSLHSEHLSNGNEDLHSFEDALAAEPDRRSGRRIPRHSHMPQGLLYTDVARYTEQVQRYFNHFGRDRVHVVLYDDFARDTAASYRDTLRFLQVSDDFTPPRFEVINPNKRVRSEEMRYFLAHPPDLPRRLIRTLVPPALRRALYERAVSVNATRPERPELVLETRRHINELFREEVDQLSSLLGRDLTHWVVP